jgi:hypothetical protein
LVDSVRLFGRWLSALATSGTYREDAVCSTLIGLLPRISLAYQHITQFQRDGAVVTGPGISLSGEGPTLVGSPYSLGLFMARKRDGS